MNVKNNYNNNSRCTIHNSQFTTEWRPDERPEWENKMATMNRALSLGSLALDSNERSDREKL